MGRSSKGRKGTALGYVKDLFAQADLLYLTQFAEGLSTGEGLIYAVRNPATRIQRGKEVTDEGITDKRLLVVETEFARPLKVMAHPTNILSTVFRNFWDTGDSRTMTRTDPLRATGAHVSFIGHITEEELNKELAECDLFNGFANRFLWFAVERSQLLPEGGQVDQEKLRALGSKLRQALIEARKVRQMVRDSEARAHWHSIYGDLTSEHSGMLGAATSRAEPQVLRLSMILALSDGSSTITLAHQKAALAIWDYCFQSANRFFGRKPSNAQAQKILNVLRAHPEGMTRKQILDEVFERNISAERLTIALRALLDMKLARCVVESTAGRNAERWFAYP